MFDVFPIFSWLAVALAIGLAISTRASDRARAAREEARVSVNWLVVPAMLSWWLLAVRGGELVKTHLVLFGLEILLAVLILRRYRSWVVAPFMLAVVCLIWSGGIAFHEARSEHPYRIGEEFRPPMGGTQASVSKSFKRPELGLALERAQRFASSGALSEFTCGDTVPSLRMSIKLIPEGRYDERRVVLNYLPDLTKMDAYRCLDRGLDYLFDETVRGIDVGPPIDYGYKNPSTGAPLYTGESNQSHKPICRCDLRNSGREWVAYTEKSAAELR